MKKFLLFLVLIGCSSTEAIHGVYGITDVEIEQRDNEYYVQYYIHVGKDVDYFTVYYYVEDELLYSERKEVDKQYAEITIGVLHGFVVTEPVEVTLVIRSVIGDRYGITDTNEFVIDVS